MRIDGRRRHSRWRLAAGPRIAAIVVASAVAAIAHAAPIARADLTALCLEAEDVADCGHRVEARQMQAYPRVFSRDGDELRISLVPFGRTAYRDALDVRGMRSYAAWDYVEDLDVAVLFTSYAGHIGFMLVLRRTGDEYAIPAEPVFSPDRRRFVTTDVCPRECDNEVTVWRIDAKGVTREAVWRPPTDWSDASATWRTNGTIALEFSTLDGSTQTIERRLADPMWQKPRTN